MHGGLLSSNSLVAIPELDLLIAAYSHQIYLFSIQEATIADKVALHEHPIVQLYYQTAQKVVFAVDQEGLVCSFRVGRHSIIEQLERYKIGKKGLITDARFRLSREADVEIITLNSDGALIRHVGQFEYLIEKTVTRIFMCNDEFIVIGRANNELQVISSASLEKLYEYKHTCAVTSVEQDQKNLIIGDEKGKITLLIDFLSNGEIKLKQKLQWHVNQVSALKVAGSYLYSAGEEGVIVLWHLRENKKDFLPRIGSQITNLQIESSKIYCILSDNTIKSIDLENDKSVLHYKVVVNPQGDAISDSSKRLIKNNLIRVATRGDKIYLRSFSGRIQEIDLFSGINTEYNILNRNFVSKLDSHLPSPHQITDISLTKDNAHLAVIIQGTNCRSIKFYEIEGSGVKLVSKVQNCHEGESNVSLCILSENRFLSYTPQDKNIKIWKLSTRRKESLLEIDDQFWCCEFSISFRDQFPRFVSVSSNKIIITYEKEFIVFNVNNKIIEGVYSLEHDNKEVVAVFQIVAKNQHQFLVFFMNVVELVSTFNNAISDTQRLITLKKSLKLNKDSIVFNAQNASFALTVQNEHSTFIYISSGKGKITHLEVPKSHHNQITDVFWLKERLLALDSSLYFYDLTHDKQLLQLSTQKSHNLPQITSQMNEQQQTESISYEHLYKRYLQRQFKKDKHTVDKNSQILSINPSISSSFHMLSGQLFL